MDYFALAKNKVLSGIYSLRDYRTKRHIVVFESDDWGSIRIPNATIWKLLLEKGYAVDRRPYERLDTLESTEDLNSLYEVLNRHQDYYGNHPIITINMLMANPDFNRIKESGYNNYFYESISETYSHYYGNDAVVDVMKRGYEDKLIMPQCHGREHFNINQWMTELQGGNEDFLTAFKYGMCGISPKDSPHKGNYLMKALFSHDEDEQNKINNYLSEGLDMFEDFWGFKSETFVAPCYCWNRSVESTLVKKGVKLLQTARLNKPSYNYSAHFYYSGQESKSGIRYSIRNCIFEPATDPKCYCVDYLVNQVKQAFKNHKIAVFSTHRINFVGGINIENRNKTLYLLDSFLKKLLQIFPDIEFKSSNSLIPFFYENCNS